MLQDKITLTFPKGQIRLDDSLMTFSIGKAKSKLISVLWTTIDFFDNKNNKLYSLTGERWVVDDTYDFYSTPFEIPTDLGNNNKREDINSYELKLHIINVDSENPLYINHLMLQYGEFKEYHQPSEVLEAISVGFNKCAYANLYGQNDSYLQIIRPNREELNTKELTKSDKTILAPHLPNETHFDSPNNLFYEYLYQYEQKIGVDK